MNKITIISLVTFAIGASSFLLSGTDGNTDTMNSFSYIGLVLMVGAIATPLTASIISFFKPKA